MLVVTGASEPVSASARHRAPRRGDTAPASARGSGGSAPRAASSHAHAIRHGSRDRPVAAGQPHGPQVAGALEPAQVADQQLAAPDRAVGRRSPVPSKIAPTAGPRLAVLGQAGGEVGVVVLDADELDALALERVRGRQVVRMQVVGDDRGRDREQPLEVRDALAKRAQRLAVARGRRCGGRPMRGRPWRRRTCS